MKEDQYDLQEMIIQECSVEKKKEKKKKICLNEEAIKLTPSKNKEKRIRQRKL